jgi:sodium/hydrogen exchanger 8
MGCFAGRFRDWNLVFILLASLACLAARAAHIFPLSFLANLGRRRRIPRKMQVGGSPPFFVLSHVRITNANIINTSRQMVIWFSGLRGAIAFALAQNMPGA